MVAIVLSWLAHTSAPDRGYKFTPPRKQENVSRLIIMMIITMIMSEMSE